MNTRRLRHRFLETRPEAPANETPEQRAARLVSIPRKEIKDNKAFLDAIRKSVAAERKS